MGSSEISAWSQEESLGPTREEKAEEDQERTDDYRLADGTAGTKSALDDFIQHKQAKGQHGQTQ